MSKEKITILFTVLVDVIGIGIIIPIMPTYVESFGVSAFVVTMLFSVFSLFSFLSSPILGVLSDKYGRRPILLASILSTSLGWLVFASARSLPLLFLGRIIDGIAAGNFSTAQSSIADLARDEKERSSSLGLIGAVFGIGFLVGPLIGGFLSRVSASFPFWFVGAMSFINVLLAYFFLPETNRHMDKDKKVFWNPIQPIVYAVKKKSIRELYIIWFLFNAIAVGTNSIFALYLLKTFGFGSYETGLFFTGIGLIVAFNQGYALKHIWLKFFSEKQLTSSMFLIFAVGFIVMIYPKILFFIIGSVLTAFGQSLLRVSITSEVVGESSKTERGQTVGVLSSIMSVASVIAPIISGFLFEWHHIVPFVVASGVSILAFVLVIHRKFPHIQQPEGIV